MRVNEQRAVKVCPFFHWALAIVLDLATPEEGLPFFIDRLQLQPNIKCVDCSPGEKMANLTGSDDDVDTDVVASPHHGVNAAQRCRNCASFSCRSLGQRRVRFLSDGKRRR